MCLLIEGHHHSNMHPFIPVLSSSFLYHPYIPSLDFSFTCYTCMCNVYMSKVYAAVYMYIHVYIRLYVYTLYNKTISLSLSPSLPLPLPSSPSLSLPLPLTPPLSPPLPLPPPTHSRASLPKHYKCVAQYNCTSKLPTLTSNIHVKRDYKVMFIGSFVGTISCVLC